MFKFHYEAQDFDHLLGTQGFSNELLKNHFTLYKGYVENTNKLTDQFNHFLKEDKTETPEFGELKRRFGWEWNGVRLHEYYFGNLTKEKHPYEEDSEIARKIQADFGSYEKWLKEFKSIGAMRGIGWTALYYDKVQDRLWNVWINEHDTGHLAGAELIVIMDVFEHAYMIDYGVKKAKYLDAFLNAVCWRAVERRYEAACQRRDARHAHPRPQAA